MKKQFLSLAAIAAIGFGVASCGNGSNETATTDSTSTTTSTATTGTDASMNTATSTNSYAAMADSVESNSAKGYYLNPKTGKPYKSLKVDRTTGAITDDAGEPVWRYVDNRNWWVYGDNDMNDTLTSWGQVGEARMDKNRLTYKGEGDTWEDYDARWMKDDEAMKTRMKVSDNGNKVKMTTEDGDKVKMKTDEEGNTKIKVNGEKMKMDSAGNVKKH